MVRMHCPLCQQNRIELYCNAEGKDYFQCQTCKLVFIDRNDLPTQAEEKALYDQHENQIDDPHYRQFLSRFFNPFIKQLTTGARGLDYGCGPGPALVAMFNEAGYHCAAYDPVYANDPDLLEKQYDFISCTEVAEHFHNPGEEFTRLTLLLKPKGYLGIMTSWYPPAAEFSRWHYQRDPTHVCFYQADTFDWIAQQFDMNWKNPAKDIAILQKN